MIQALRDQQAQIGGKIQTLPHQVSWVETYGQDAAALEAIETGVALCDRSHWGRIRMGDRDRHSFLHNQSTNEIKTLQPGQGCETVIVTSTARTLDLASVYCTKDTLILLISPHQSDQLLPWFDRYIFFNDKVTLEDITHQTGCFSLIGPQSKDFLAQLGWSCPDTDHHYEEKTFENHSVLLIKGSGLATEGYTLIFPMEIALPLWISLCSAQTLQTVPMGETAWEVARIRQGRPKAGAELTEEFNPLEARLWHAVSFNKGCYIGQETIARLNTYDGVKQKLWGLSLSAQSQAGTPITYEDKKVGILTSVVQQGNQTFGLGYIKSKTGGEGLSVQVGEASATVHDVPYLSQKDASTSE